MKIPDYISPIIGYRAWQFDGNNLRSLNGQPWSPGKALVGSCRRPSADHTVPRQDCSCGVYAFKASRRAQGYCLAASIAAYSARGLGCLAYLHGEVTLWGTIVEHEDGWRAEFAYPQTIVISLQGFRTLSFAPQSFPFEDVEGKLKPLTAYRVPMNLAVDNRVVSLWTPHAGYNVRELNRLRRYYTITTQQKRSTRPLPPPGGPPPPPGGPPPPPAAPVCSALDILRVFRAAICQAPAVA